MQNDYRSSQGFSSFSQIGRWNLHTALTPVPYDASSEGAFCVNLHSSGIGIQGQRRVLQRLHKWRALCSQTASFEVYAHKHKQAGTDIGFVKPLYVPTYVDPQPTLPRTLECVCSV
jgi:hypothetical protein